MVERVSALAGHLEPRVLGPVGAAGPGVRISEIRLGGLWQVAAWPGRLAEAGAAVAASAGVAAAPGFGQAAFGSRGTALRTEALKWLVASPHALSRPEIAVEDGTALDLSHARTVLRLEGPAARDVLARLVAIDLRAQAFPDGRVAVTGAHGMGLTLVAREGGVDVLAFRSFGLALLEMLEEIAAQFGAEIG